eukprot:s2051_g17.t1
MLDEELRKNTAQTSTDRPAEVDLEQLFIDAHQATGADLLQQSGMAESTETFDTSDPLTPFLAYVLFRVALSQQSFRRFLAHFYTLRNAKNSRSEASSVSSLQTMVDHLTQ